MKHKLRLYGIRAPVVPPSARPMTQTRLPKRHPCYGCPFIDCRGTVPFCNVLFLAQGEQETSSCTACNIAFSCLRKDYEKWRRQQQAEYINRRKSKEVSHD